MKTFKNSKSVLVILMILLGVSLSCKFLKENVSKSLDRGPVIDFTKPEVPRNVTVDLDKKQTTSSKVSPDGGSVSLKAADGSVFTLEVPAKALDAETMITMTVVKSMTGAPLDNNTPTAVQFEPSGLFLKEIATLTIVPGKDIPIKQQLIFGYDSDGKDYRMMPVDPKSKEIKVRMMHFSGAGVGSASDVAWAANLMIQASNASERILQKLGELTQTDRRKQLLGEGGDSEFEKRLFSLLGQFEDQVVLKEMVAAELDCKHAMQAARDLIFLERMRQLMGMEDGTKDWNTKLDKLMKINDGCSGAYRVSGVSNNVSFTGEICSLNKPFDIAATFPGGTAKTSFAPSGAESGTTTVSGGGGGCVQSGGGNYSVTIAADGSGTLTWTSTDKIACPGFSNGRTVTFTLPLQPAPDLSCP
ncbi:hypothetical protein BH10ACI3_BH10ACI3_21860 [soil metagenome]